MEEFDSHTEHVHDQANEAAHESKERWVTGVALTAAILAALAAITSMLAGHHEHEAMMQQMKASDGWGRYQAKKIKTLLREERIEVIEQGGGKADDKLKKKVSDSQSEQKGLFDQCRALELSSRFHDHLHMFFGSGVTLFQVAIAVAAISALTRRRGFWLVGIGLGALALGCLAAGLLFGGGVLGHRPPAPQEQEQNETTDAGPPPTAAAEQ